MTLDSVLASVWYGSVVGFIVVEIIRSALCIYNVNYFSNTRQACKKFAISFQEFPGMSHRLPFPRSGFSFIALLMLVNSPEPYSCSSNMLLSLLPVKTGLIYWGLRMERKQNVETDLRGKNSGPGFGMMIQPQPTPFRRETCFFWEMEMAKGLGD